MLIPRLEYVLFAGYLLAGPVMWAFYAWGMYEAQRRMVLIKQPREPVPPLAPSVAIFIPAKDERQRIGDCVRSALGQSYPNFRVVAVDDRSSDGTGAVLDELALRNSRLAVLHISELPNGWTGKCHALHQAAQAAADDWLLFVDSDVILESDALAAVLGLAIGRNYGLVSVLPRLECQTLWEGLLVPLAGAAFCALLGAALTNSNRSRCAVANGQFLLVRRDAYEAAGGHAAVRDQYCEDVVMARVFKRSGLRPRLSWGTDLCAVRMYDSFSKIMRGWSRIFFAADSGSPWRSLLGIAFVIVCCYSVFPALGWGIYRQIHPAGVVRGYCWIAASIVHWAAMTYQIGVMYHWTRNSRRYALAFPVTAVLLLAILVRAVRMCVTRRVEWRGTQYQYAMKHGVATGE
jgi:chlorobactene glucosyltransferase